MFRSTVRAALAFGFAAFAGIGPSSANVVTFAGMSDMLIDVTQWVEDGITVTGSPGSSFGYFQLPDTLHVDGASPYSNAVGFTMASAFDAASIDIIPVPVNGVHSMLCEGALCDIPFINVLFAGYAGADLVAILGLWMGESPFTLFFPETFSGLTRLRLSMLTNSNCMDQPCTHMNIDNVTLVGDDTIAPIPLPAALPLFAGGLAALGAGGLWRRRGRARPDRRRMGSHLGASARTNPEI